MEIFSNNFNEKEKNGIKNYFDDINQENKESLQEERILNKLSLRKKKLDEIISCKRKINIINKIQTENEDKYLHSEHKIILYTKQDFISGDLYIKLKSAYDLNDSKNIKEILDNILDFFHNKKMDNIELKEYFMKSGCNVINNSDNDIIKKEKYPFASLLLNIGLNTENKIIYIYCFNFILNFSFISNEFCQEITNEKNINLILEKLIHFYPFFIENHINNLNENKNNLESINNNKYNALEKVESFYIGIQIFKLLGNLYISSNSCEPFELNNFYNKVFYLLYIFNIEENDTEYKSYYFQFLETLIWILNLFYQKDEKFVVNYKDKILLIIPKLFEFIKMLYYTQAIDLLEIILISLEYFADISQDFLEKIVEVDGVKILTNLFTYLFDNEYNNEDFIILNEIIINKILGLFINIFTLESKCFKTLDDYSSFSIVLEKLFNKYKIYPSNDSKIQQKLILLMSNLACFNDINDINQKIIINEKIINILFKKYYPYYKSEIALFIANVMEKQPKMQRDILLNLGGFQIIQDIICNESKTENIKLGIKALFHLINQETGYNINLLFQKIYNTTIPTKIKNLILYTDITVDNDTENIECMMKNIIRYFDIYENSI